MVKLTMAVLFLACWVVCFCQDFDEVQEDAAGEPTFIQYGQGGDGNVKNCFDIHGHPKKCNDIPAPLDNALGLVCLCGAAVVSFFYLKKHRENGYNQ